MTAPTVPPHPGPRPADFEFPFAEARAAIEALDACAERLVETVGTHRDAAAHARVDFEGDTRQEFDRTLQDTTEDLDRVVQRLREQAGDLEETVTLAEQRRQASLDAIASWDAALSAHHDGARAAQAAAAS